MKTLLVLAAFLCGCQSITITDESSCAEVKGRAGVVFSCKRYRIFLPAFLVQEAPKP